MSDLSIPKDPQLKTQENIYWSNKEILDELKNINKNIQILTEEIKNNKTQPNLFDLFGQIQRNKEDDSDEEDDDDEEEDDDDDDEEEEETEETEETSKISDVD